MNQTEGKPHPIISNKEPWLAASFSTIVPGYGQIYAGKIARGCIILAISCLLFATGILAILNPNKLMWGALCLAVGTIALQIWSVFDAYHVARNSNSKEFEFRRKQQNKDLWLAVLLSSIIPGLGQLYLNRSSGYLFLFLTLFTSPRDAIVFRFILKMVALFNIGDLITTWQKRSRQATVMLISGFLILTLLEAGVNSSIQRSVIEARQINLEYPTDSMLPTLRNGDSLTIDKLTYRYRDPQRGDVAVFSPTSTMLKKKFKEDITQRIIGLPSERVDIRNGKVFINDRALTEKYISTLDGEVPPSLSDRYNWSSKTLTPDGKVPQNQYIVLGDNRNKGLDSRYWGLVPRANIIGRATNRFYPFDRVGSLAAG